MQRHKNSDYDKFSDYSEEKYEYDGEDDCYSNEPCHYRPGKEVLAAGQGKGCPPKEQMKRSSMKGVLKQQCERISAAYGVISLSLFCHRALCYIC